MLQIISILMENRPGSLMRVTGLFAQRNYNIESLTVARTLDPDLSRMTIVADVDPKIRVQVIKQINKLVNVLQATDITEVLLKVKAKLENRTAILKEAEIFGARVIDSSVEGFALEATGAPEKLDEFINVMQSYGDTIITRSGITGMSLDMKKLRLSPPISTGAEAEKAEKHGVLTNG
jgi:acetolactate synthase I/III small subunit